MQERHMVPVWFFVGLVLAIDGSIIEVTGIREWSHPAGTVLSGYHTAVWWGLLLLALGGFYVYKFWPRKS